MFRNSNGHISAMRRVINFCFGSVVSLSGSPDRTALHPCGLAVILKKKFRWPYLCNALFNSVYVCTQTIDHTLPSNTIMTVDVYDRRLVTYFAREDN